MQFSVVRDGLSGYAPEEVLRENEGAQKSFMDSGLDGFERINWVVDPAFL